MINLGYRPAAPAIRSVLTFGGAVGGLPLMEADNQQVTFLWHHPSSYP